VNKQFESLLWDSAPKLKSLPDCPSLHEHGILENVEGTGMKHQRRKCLNVFFFLLSSPSNAKTFKKANTFLNLFISCPSLYYSHLCISLHISVFNVIETASWRFRFIQQLKLHPTNIFGPQPVCWIFFSDMEDRLRTIGFPQDKLHFPTKSHWEWDLKNVWTGWKGSLKAWCEAHSSWAEAGITFSCKLNWSQEAPDE